MSMATERVLAAPDLLKLALYFLPDWVRYGLGAATLVLLTVYGVGKLRRLLAARRTLPEHPAK